MTMEKLKAVVNQVFTNLPVDQGTALLPPGCQKLGPSPSTEFRVAVSGPRVLNRLNRPVFASFRGVIDGREGTDEALH